MWAAWMTYVAYFFPIINIHAGTHDTKKLYLTECEKCFIPILNPTHLQKLFLVAHQKCIQKLSTYNVFQFNPWLYTQLPFPPGGQKSINKCIFNLYVFVGINETYVYKILIFQYTCSVQISSGNNTLMLLCNLRWFWVSFTISYKYNTKYFILQVFMIIYPQSYNGIVSLFKNELIYLHNFFILLRVVLFILC